MFRLFLTPISINRNLLHGFKKPGSSDQHEVDAVRACPGQLYLASLMGCGSDSLSRHDAMTSGHSLPPQPVCIIYTYVCTLSLDSLKNFTK